jgi:hypothetical protein
MDEKEIQDLLENTPPEERAKAWEEYVRNEVNSLLDTFLPEAVSGNVGIKYEHPSHGFDSKTGKEIIDESTATGVYLSIMFEFAAPIKFYDEKPEDAE